MGICRLLRKSSGISIGNLWMFIGLLVMTRKAEANVKKED